MSEKSSSFQENVTNKQEAGRMRFSADLVLTEGAEAIRELGGQGPLKSRVTKAVRLVSEFLAEPMSHGRAENILRREARPQAHEMDALRAARRKQREEAARAKAHELATVYARMADQLASKDAEFHCRDILGLLHVARALGEEAGPAVVAGVVADAEGEA